jgi:hypothetical protein
MEDVHILSWNVFTRITWVTHANTLHGFPSANADEITVSRTKETNLSVACFGIHFPSERIDTTVSAQIKLGLGIRNR